MERLIDGRTANHSPETLVTPEGLRVTAESYSILFDAKRPYAHLYDRQSEAWGSFSLTGSVDLVGLPDEMIERPEIEVSEKMARQQ